MYIQHLMIFRTFAPAFQKRITDKKKKNMRLSEQRSSMLHGVLLIALFRMRCFRIGGMDWVKASFV